MSNEEKAKTIADERYPDKSYWIGSGDNARLYDPNATSNRVFIEGYIAATAQLEADKAELVEAFTDVLSRFPSEFTGIYDKTIRRGILTAPISDIEQWRTLIQKHAAK